MLSIASAMVEKRVSRTVAALRRRFERSMMLERQREGIAKAKAEGKLGAVHQPLARKPARLRRCLQVARARPRLQKGSALDGHPFTGRLLSES